MNNRITYKVERCANCAEQVYHIRDAANHELGTVAMSDGYLHKEAHTSNTFTIICENRKKGNRLVSLIQHATEEKS